MKKNDVVEKIITKREAQERLAKLEEQVGAIYNSVAIWKQAGLPQKTIVVLLHHYTKISQRTIRRVLEGLDILFEEYFEDGEDDDD